MRTTRGLASALVVAAVTALAGCTTTIPHPWVGTTRHLCCNLRYERTTITDVNYQRGTLIPVGTPVQVTRVTNKGVVFEAPNHPPITLVLKYGRRQLSLDDYLDRILVATDPRRALARLPKRTRTAIEEGRVEPGMTREQVLMAIGYPPAHRTPTLSSPEWLYWRNRWETFTVRFKGDRVTSVSR
jgi:outer membrane protein assembly factor BamE (lipoprotein component of BamABCDE complex)